MSNIVIKVHRSNLKAGSAPVICTSTEMPFGYSGERPGIYDTWLNKVTSWDGNRSEYPF